MSASEVMSLAVKANSPPIPEPSFVYVSPYLFKFMAPRLTKCADLAVSAVNSLAVIVS